MTKYNWAILAAIFSGLTFGIYWIPLRHLDQAGFSGTWAVVLFNLIPLIILSPLLLYRIVKYFPKRTKFHIATVLTGVGYVFYANSFLYTEVVRAIIFFYLMPIWGFLIGRLFGGERITVLRWISMAVGFCGLLVISGDTSGIALPNQPGDWMALGAGIVWAFASFLILTDEEDVTNYALGMVFWATVFSLCLALFATQNGYSEMPNWDRLSSVVPWMLLFTILIVIPATYATVFGPSQLNPGVVGLLYMTEISIGTATAAVFAGEPFGMRELLGVTLITLAGLSEPLGQKFSSLSKPLKSDPT